MAVFISSIAQVILKRSAIAGERTGWKRYLNPGVASGYAILFCMTLLTVYAYRGVPLKAGPVLQSSGYVFVAFMSRYFFEEKLSPGQWRGLFLIVAGIIVFHL
jgi:multidrug transporter EmrE-like cation transporter